MYPAHSTNKGVGRPPYYYNSNIYSLTDRVDTKQNYKPNTEDWFKMAE